MNTTEIRRVKILHWQRRPDDVAFNLALGLEQLGYQTESAYYLAEDDLSEADFLFTYAPWGPLQHITARMSQIDPDKRPFWIHWSTEDCPDLRLPRALVKHLGQWIARLERLQEGSQARYLPAIRWSNSRFHKFRYVGSYAYALQKGLMRLVVEFSKVYADHYVSMGLPVRYAPWGLLEEMSPLNEDALPKERDIDVLWIGTRRTRRRSRLLDQIMEELSAYGRKVCIVDGVHHPPVYHQERAALLRRAKITLNLLPTWYDSALAYRWPLVAAHRSLCVSETSLPHNPALQPGLHYVSAPPSDLVETILYYLDHPELAAPIIERAYTTVTQGHRFQDSVRQIMLWAEQGRQAACRVVQTASTMYQSTHTFTIPLF